MCLFQKFKNKTKQNKQKKKKQMSAYGPGEATTTNWKKSAH